MRLKSIHIKDFKRIRDLEIDLEDVTLLVGGNNSGKSSALQAIHFAVSTLRAARANGKRPNQPATTLGLNQFKYLPTNEIMRIRHAAGMTQQSGPSIQFTYLTDSQQRFTHKLYLYRGKNANVQILFPRGAFYNEASSLTRPFSIFVPGLAGISLAEEYRANSIITSGLAQGDSNLYLRNVLHRLFALKDKLKRFYQIVRPIFPNLELRSHFDEDENQYLFSEIKLGGTWRPLELAGTGALQAIQVAAYATLYEPALLLLDEPDAHLHPGNQKQMVDMAFELAAQTSTQVIMASHSRHVLDKVARNPLGCVRWLKGGKLQSNSGADLSLLMDIGALDDFEELSKARVKRLVFCEDANTTKIEILLKSSGLDLDEVHIVSFDGIDNLSATKTVVEFFLGLGPDRRAIIYRDGDCMTEDEKTWLRGKAAGSLPDGASLYISKFTDIEHYFCQPKHIAQVAGISESDAVDIINKCLEDDQARLAVKITNKRNDLKNKSQKGNGEFASTEKLLDDGVPFSLALGSILLPAVLDALKEHGSPVARLDIDTEYIGDPDILDLFA